MVKINHTFINADSIYDVLRIGTSEKGRLTVKLSVRTTGGHSSMPTRETSIGILANAVARYQTHNISYVIQRA